MLVYNTLHPVNVITHKANIDEIGIRFEHLYTVESIEGIREFFARTKNLDSDVIVIFVVLKRGNRHSLDDMRQTVQRHIEPKYLF